jgi:hypothetical protein
MMIFWKIRYLDRNDRAFKDRNLFLDTRRLDAATRAAVEFALDTKTSANARNFLKYRDLFTEDNSPDATRRLASGDRMNGFSLHEYFEDENGRELSNREMAQILTGSPTAVMFPSGTPEHFVELTFAERKPIPVGEVSLSGEDLKILGYFARDLRELSESAFMRDGPGTITSSGGSDPVLHTAVTDDEIRSFATIFRRLYMQKEPANYQKAVAIFANALGDHPYAKWAAAEGQEFVSKLEQPPQFIPVAGNQACRFTRKRLIDVFLYTQYAHQPDKKGERQQQFEDCLNELGGRKGVFTWLFLTELWQCSIDIQTAGRVIAAWFTRYCDHHRVSPDVLPSLRHEHPGIGAAEKAEAREVRIFGEKAEALAISLWNERGCPPGGHVQFRSEAEQLLSKTMR